MQAKNVQMLEKNTTNGDEKTLRLDIYLKDRGLGSRRALGEAIKSGHALVNGEKVLTPGFALSPNDKVVFCGKSVKKQISPLRFFRYYKPRGVLTSHHDPHGRPTVFEQIMGSLSLHHIVSVGRLDFTSEGLLLLTTHGPLARALEHPETGAERTYHVRVHGFLSDTHLDALEKGVTVNGMRYRPLHIKRLRSGKTNHWLEMTLSEGKNREIRKLMAHFGCEVNKLIRLSYGGFKLEGLSPGEVKEVSLATLRKALRPFAKTFPEALRTWLF